MDGNDWLLFNAITRKETELALALLDYGSEVDAQDIKNNTPLHYCASFYYQFHAAFKIAEALINKKAVLDSQNVEGDTALHFCVMDPGNFKLTKLLVDSGASLNIINSQGETPLHIASRNNDYETVQLLLSKNADVNIQNENGDTPLHLAIGENLDGNIIQLLLDSGASVKVKNKKSLTPIYLLINERFLFFPECEAIIENLIQKGAYAHLKTSEGETLLHAACRNGLVRTVKILVKQGACINAQNSEGLTPLTVALSNCDEITELLFRKGMEESMESSKKNLSQLTATAQYLYVSRTASKIFMAFKNMSNRIAVNLLNDYKKPHLDMITDNTINDVLNILRSNIKELLPIQEKNDRINLHILCINKLHIAEVLIGARANVNIKDKKGNVILHTLAWEKTCDRKRDATKMIIDSGALLDVKDTNGNTPLILALIKDNFKIAKLLIRGGADVNAHNNTKDTPLHFSVYKSCFSKILTNDQGYNQTQISLMLETDSIVLTLLVKGADINAQNADGNTPFHIFCSLNNGYNSSWDNAYILLRHGANFNIQNNKGDTPLHIAATNDELMAVGLLKSKFITNVEALVNIQNKEGNTPLHIAASSEYLSLTISLLMFGATVDIKNNVGNTALHKARNSEIAECLLNAGASVDLKNSESKTPYDLSEGHPSHYTLTNHVIKLETAGFKVDIQLCLDDSSFKFYCQEEHEDLKLKCFKELDLMKHTEIGEGSKLIIVFVERNNPYYLECQELLSRLQEILNNQHMEQEFPLYCQILRNTFKKTRIRFELLQLASLSFDTWSLKSLNLGDDQRWPELVKERILYYLNNSDLEHLINAI